MKYGPIIMTSRSWDKEGVLPTYASPCSEALRAGRIMDKIPVGLRRSALVQTSPWAYSPTVHWLLGFPGGTVTRQWR
jgi:hypothetical protein